MNNDQFRRLVAVNSTKSAEKNGSASPPSASASTARPAALGSRLKSSIPMTPRAGGPRPDFARQLFESMTAKNKPSSSSTQKKTSAPKGTKLAAGYIDRAKTRQEQQEEEDERAQRINSLEESFKKGEIDRETYDRLRNEIAGGDLSSTHLVKGLDRKLLERMRRGEDISKPATEPERLSPPVEEKEEKPEEEEEEEEDPDALLERLESAQVKSIQKEKIQKKGQVATVALNPGQKRTRAQIIAELKASRAAKQQQPPPAAEPEPTLGSRFKKIGARQQTPGTRIERDSKGREVLIIVDEDGHERRKIRKIDPKLQEQEEREREMAIQAAKRGEVLGMEVPEFYRKQQEELRRKEEEKEKEITIFDDVESDYDPLAGLESDDGSSSSGGEEEEGEEGELSEGKEKEDMSPPPKPSDSGHEPRNYFKNSKTALTSQEEYKPPSLNDPALLAALKKAKAISLQEKSEEERKAVEREERLRRKLAESNRDDDDLDFGFGSSRVEDDADLGGDNDRKTKMSEWKDTEMDDYDDDGGEDGGHEGGSGGKRKKGGKKGKKKGDKNNFADVMRVMERQKGGSG